MVARIDECNGRFGFEGGRWADVRLCVLSNIGRTVSSGKLCLCGSTGLTAEHIWQSEFSGSTYSSKIKRIFQRSVFEPPMTKVELHTAIETDDGA